MAIKYSKEEENLISTYIEKQKIKNVVPRDLKPDYKKISIFLTEITENFVRDIGNKTKDENLIVGNDDIQKISIINNFLITKKLTDYLDFLRMNLYLTVQKIKHEFLLDAKQFGVEHNDFFVYTINVAYRQNPNYSLENKDIPIFKKGYLEGIYWAERKVIKQDGKARSIYRRIPLANEDNNKFRYTKKSFHGSKNHQYQIDLCMKYEDRLEPIRKLNKMISNLKHTLAFARDLSEKISAQEYVFSEDQLEKFRDIAQQKVDKDNLNKLEELRRKYEEANQSLSQNSELEEYENNDEFSSENLLDNEEF